MSIQSKQNDVARIQRELAALRKQDADAAKAEANVAKDAEQTGRHLQTTRSESSVRTYRQKLVRLSGDLAKAQGKRATISKSIADKLAKLHQAEQALSKELEQDRKKLLEAQKKREKEQIDHQRKLTSELQRQRALVVSAEGVASPGIGPGKGAVKVHDAFISHASEDKEGFVRPLAEALKSAGFDVWYDEFALTVGDSLRQTIDRGLAKSRFGIVVLSSAFFAKNWTQYELNGLVAKEMEGRKVVLPIWHKVSKDEVLQFSPPLADKVAINSSVSSLPEIVAQLSEVLRR